MLIAGVFTQAKAAVSCSMAHITQRDEVKALVQEDAYLQWLKWEQTANVFKFHQPTARIELPISRVALQKVEIQADPSLAKSIKKIFVQKQDGKKRVLWVKHPHNTVESVPFFDKKIVDHVEAYYTASRSMVLGGELRGFTLKAPTDHPHGPDKNDQPSKADTSGDVISALLHSEHISSQDKKLGQDDVLIILPEILTIADKKTQIGYVVRDVRHLDDGHYYLPAFSIPYVGREIAKINGQPFEKFWAEHYAKLLGEAKARLLLRYGLQMESPNPQNMLIQLDRNLKPTGRIAIRDLSDAFFVEDIAQALGFKKAVKKDIDVDYLPQAKLHPFVSNSFWRMDAADNKSISEKTLDKWKIIHNRQFTSYILRELKIDNLELLRDNTEDLLNDLYEFLTTPLSLERLKNYSVDAKNKENEDKKYQDKAG